MAQQIDPSFYANLAAGAPPPGVISNFDHPESRAVDAHVGMGYASGLPCSLGLRGVEAIQNGNHAPLGLG